MDERASDSDKTMQKGDSEVYSDDLHGGENRVTALETIMPGDTTANRPGEERRNRKKRPPPLNLRLLPPPSLPAVQMPFGHPYPGSSPRRYAFSSHARYQNGEEVVQDESLDNATRAAEQQQTDHALVPDIRLPPLPQHFRDVQETASMDYHGSEGSDMHTAGDYQPDEQIVGHLQPASLPPVLPNIGQSPPTPASLPRRELQNLTRGPQTVQLSFQINANEIARQNNTIRTLAIFNEEVFGYLHALDVRLLRIEDENARLREVIENHVRSLSASRSSTISPEAPAARGESSRSAMDFGEHAESSHDAPEASSAAAARSPHTQSPVTPKKEPNTTPKREPSSLLNKRKIHNLTNKLPPAMTQVPLIPLTDTEIVVYLFNSLSRPVVTVRLYARGWGPAKIVEVLNAHRAVDPPYLRNTCSVKCTTAQRRGIDKFGEDWLEETRKEFREADDVRATELLTIQDDECEEPVDVDVLELLNGLIKHPDEREDSTTAAGIFTRCVRHCAENNMRCKMSRIHELAQSLELDGSPERRTYAGTGDSKHDSVASEPMDNADDEANNVAEMDEV